MISSSWMMGGQMAMLKESGTIFQRTKLYGAEMSVLTSLCGRIGMGMLFFSKTPRLLHPTTREASTKEIQLPTSYLLRRSGTGPTSTASSTIPGL